MGGYPPDYHAGMRRDADGARGRQQAVGRGSDPGDGLRPLVGTQRRRTQPAQTLDVGDQWVGRRQPDFAAQIVHDDLGRDCPHDPNRRVQIESAVHVQPGDHGERGRGR